MTAEQLEHAKYMRCACCETCHDDLHCIIRKDAPCLRNHACSIHPPKESSKDASGSASGDGQLSPYADHCCWECVEKPCFTVEEVDPIYHNRLKHLLRFGRVVPPDDIFEEWGYISVCCKCGHVSWHLYETDRGRWYYILREIWDNNAGLWAMIAPICGKPDNITKCPYEDTCSIIKNPSLEEVSITKGVNLDIRKFVDPYFLDFDGVRREYGEHFYTRQPDGHEQ